MRELFPSILLILTIGFSVNAQTKKRKSTPKIPPIRAIVTVKGDLPPPPKLPSESDPGIWNRLSVAEHKLSIEFPSKIDDIDTEKVDVGGTSVFSYAASTEKAVYRFAIRDLPVIVGNDEIEEILENSIKTAFIRPDFKLVRKRNVFYDGHLGKEFVIEEKKAVQYGRVFVLNRKLLLMFVTVEPKSSRDGLEKWVEKFFNSFEISLPIVNQA